MKTKNHTALKSLLVRGGAYSLLFSSAFAADATWNGSANTNLGNGTNWSSGSATFGANETATWNNTQTGNLSLQWNGNLGPSSGNAGGLNLSITSANTGSLQLDGVTGNLGLGDVTIASGAGAFTLGDGVGSATVVYRDPTTTLTNNSANAATIKSDIGFLNGGGPGNRNITFAGSGNWVTEGSVISALAFGSTASSAFITKNGTGTLTLAGANGHGGGATLNDGVIAVSNGSALGTAGTVAINGGFGTRIDISNNIALTGPTAINLTGRNNTPDNTSSGATIRNVSGNNSISANLVFANTGGANVNILSTAGTLTLGGNLSTTLTTSVRTFNLTGAGDIVSNGVISNGSATVGIFKNGTGTLTINNATNSYTGATQVNAGKLLLGTSGTLGASSAVTVGGTTATPGSSPTLGGGGTINGAAVISSAGAGAVGTHAPGITGTNGGVGTQTFKSSLTYQAGSIFEWDLKTGATGAAATQFDAVTVDSATGSLAVDNNATTGSIFKVVLGEAFAGGNAFWSNPTQRTWDVFATTNSATLGANTNIFSRFQLFDTSSATIPVNFSSFGSFGFTNNGSTGTLTWTAVPEPTSALAGLLIAAGLLRRRRREVQ